jgi:hypothetical protein
VAREFDGRPSGRTQRLSEYEFLEGLNGITAGGSLNSASGIQEYQKGIGLVRLEQGTRL